VSTAKFEAWVPQAARKRINELCTMPFAIDDTNRRLLERLATYLLMKTDVWEKLPSEPQGIEGTIIDWAYSAYTIFPALPRPYPKTKAKWREWATRLEKHAPPPDPAYLSQLSHQLWEDISRLKGETDFYWPSLWDGDKSITPDQVLSTLDQLRAFYARMDNEYQKFLATFPRVSRWNAKAAQKFFTEFLSSRMKEAYGQPLDAIVAVLAEVAFDIRKGLSPETVRGRRRIGRGPENLKRKSR
jgi:hypothetical protein